MQQWQSENQHSVFVVNQQWTNQHLICIIGMHSLAEVHIDVHLNTGLPRHHRDNPDDGALEYLNSNHYHLNFFSRNDLKQQ